MRNRVLHTLSYGGTYRLQDLEKELGIGSALLEAMIDELVQLGYLQMVEGACTTSCEACCQHASCLVQSRGRMWALTDRGRHAARRSHG